MAGFRRTFFSDKFRVLNIPDLHVPFEDMNAISPILSFANFFRPHAIFFMGDLVDFYTLSKYSKDPERKVYLADEVAQGKAVLKFLRQELETNDTKEWYFLEGNHEARLKKYLWGRAAELAGLQGLTVPFLLETNKLGIDYIESGWKIYKQVMFKHGTKVRSKSAYTATAELEKAWMSGFSGHTHRLGKTYRQNESGKYWWVESGYLGKEKEFEYIDGVADWQQGFSIGWGTSKKIEFGVEIPIIKGKAVWGDCEFY